MIVSQAPDFERQMAPYLRPGHAHNQLFPAIFEEPALLAAAIFLSTGHLLATRREPPQAKDIYPVLQMQGVVIRSINAALRSPKRSVSDHTIVAVLLLATYEALHGLTDAYHLHMTGMIQMINHRGGMAALGMHGYVELFILWQDANVANIVGGAGYAHLANNPTAGHKAKPDKSMFLLR